MSEPHPNNTDNQPKSSVEHLRPFQWKKGQSGNIMGRPKGKTMKEYAKEFLQRMTDEERDEWLEGINKDTIWEMAEGKAKQDVDVKAQVSISDVLDNLDGQKTS